MNNPIRVRDIELPESMIQITHRSRESLVELAEELNLPVYMEQRNDDDDRLFFCFDGQIIHRYDDDE